VFNGSIWLQEFAPIGEGIRGYVKDPHDVGALGQIQPDPPAIQITPPLLEREQIFDGLLKKPPLIKAFVYFQDPLENARGPQEQNPPTKAANRGFQGMASKVPKHPEEILQVAMGFQGGDLQTPGATQVNQLIKGIPVHT